MEMLGSTVYSKGLLESEPRRRHLVTSLFSLSCSEEATQASLELQMAPGQPGEKPRPRLHHLPQQSALRPPRRPPSSSVSGPGLRPGPALPLPGCRTRERESAGRPPSSCVPRTPQCMRHPDPPRSSQLPWEEGPAGGARPTRRLQKLRLREGQRRAPGQKGGVRAAGVGPAPTSGRAARGEGTPGSPAAHGGAPGSGGRTEG